MSKQRSIRTKRALDELEQLSEGEAEADVQPKLTAEDIKLLQKQRQRRTGVEASTLAMPDSRPQHKSAGLPEQQQDVLQAAFKRERRLQSEEEDPHMKSYIEEQLARRMGRPSLEAEAAAEEEAARQRDLADPLAAALPKELQKRQQDTELGPSWVTGILEVPLSMEQKLKNIEDTEAAKKKLLAVGEEEDGGGGGEAVLRRRQYPVSFGKQNPKLLKAIADVHAKKARQRAYWEEKKQKKKEEFAGW